MKRFLPPHLFLACAALMVVLWWVFPIARLLEFPFTLLGIVPLIIGLGVNIKAASLFSKLGTNILTFNDPGIFVTTGLYRLSRNPMYLGFGITLLGLSILLGALSSLLAAIAYFVITDRWYISFEEKAMAKKFGHQYEAYRTNTRRWL